jgi:hypothetical protein
MGVGNDRGRTIRVIEKTAKERFRLHRNRSYFLNYPLPDNCRWGTEAYKRDFQMKRRNFLTTAAVGSVTTLAGAAFSEGTAPIQAKLPLNKYKITVLKRTLNDEWNKEFGSVNDSPCCGPKKPPPPS